MASDDEAAAGFPTSLALVSGRLATAKIGG